MPNPPSLAVSLRILSGTLGRGRQMQFLLTIALMVAGAAAELVTIGAVFPFLALVASLDQTGLPPILQSAFSRLDWLAQDGAFRIQVFAVILAAAAVISTIIRLALTWVTQRFVYGVQCDLSLAVYDRVVNQRYDHYVRMNSSDILAAIEKIYVISVGMIAPVIIAITSMGIAASIVILLFYIDPGTTIIAASTMGVLYVAISIFTKTALSRVSRRAAEVRVERTKLLQESLGGMRDIILDNSQEAFKGRLARIENEVWRLNSVSNFVANAPRFVVEGAGICLIAVLAVYFSHAPGGVVGALPILGALALGAQRVLPLLQAIYLGWTSYSINRHNLSDVLHLLSIPRRPVQLPDGTDSRPFRRLELRDVSYWFEGPDSAPTLAHIDLTIEAGQRIGLVGKSGSGKSTLADIIMGLLSPHDGQMIVDRQAITSESMLGWQQRISHVPQAIFLADDTIGGNIAFGSGDRPDLVKAQEAARKANLADFIEQLPKGMDTIVGERGIRLSGGQRQRIGIARALYRNASIIVLDEATSALDDETEAIVMDAVRGLAGDITIIIIAHRLSTLRDCETIYRLRGGRIVQAGSYHFVVGDHPSQGSISANE